MAILSRLPLEDVTSGLPGDDSDEQARWIEATVTGDSGAVRVCGLYLPNGNPAPGPKYDYKLKWMTRLQARAADLLAAEEPALMAGDYNVIPAPEDARKPEAWADDALALPETRAAWRRIVNLGFTDAFRARHHGPGHYTFWDYQAGAWQRDNGIRIDHFLLTPQAADLLTDCRHRQACARARQAVRSRPGLGHAGHLNPAAACQSPSPRDARRHAPRTTPRIGMENLRGSILMVLAMAGFALEDMFIKRLSADLP